MAYCGGKMFATNKSNNKGFPSSTGKSSSKSYTTNIERKITLQNFPTKPSYCTFLKKKEMWQSNPVFFTDREKSLHRRSIYKKIFTYKKNIITYKCIGRQHSYIQKELATLAIQTLDKDCVTPQNV